ncbi:MAG: 50S ribosomal protein L14 [Nanoarchaeota archaeon]|nr:50S ribosomal protein L14 [Nanoarchaeota archaeon]MBU1321360.1 50S ribosomal protein L14 [Nanoarchaeota archaeon]MBU1597352.1 50S ribosomal protein L14 [Nanoarchaeota archaeon]MBU2441267.1 50S ribosomal protein L14 [Nanoarchaeota archaeon]
MKASKARITKGLQKDSKLPICDNSGAKMIKIISVKRSKTVKGRTPSAGVGDMITASVIKGRPDMRKQVVFAIIVRQKREYRRANGVRIKFEDNAAIVLKDEKGNPKGTIFKGPIAKEVTEKWPAVAKIANMVV